MFFPGNAPSGTQLTLRRQNSRYPLSQFGWPEGSWQQRHSRDAAAEGADIAGDQQGLQTRPPLARLLDQFQAIHLWHSVIDDEEVDFRGLFQDAQSRVWSVCYMQNVTLRLKNLA